MTTALMIAALIVAAYAALAVGLWHFQERIVFQPPRFPGGPEVPGATRLSFVSPDGTRLAAFVVGNVASRRVVLAFHGNAVVARAVIPWATEVAERMNVCIVLA